LSSPERLGVAIDLGTTTIAAALVELTSGAIRGRCGTLNPQRGRGLDVVSRLEYAGRSRENLLELKELVNLELCGVVRRLGMEAGVDPAGIEALSIAGNPTMSHLLLGLEIDTLARPPYRPRDTSSHRLSTAELGWDLDIPAYIFPSPGGFVGGDTVAFLYGLGINSGARSEERGAGSGAGENDEHASFRTSDLGPRTCLYLDLGTNGEIALLAGGRLYATSAAAGPAFEGGNLFCGMAALPGAIHRVYLDAGRLAYDTVGGGICRGVCGSGILDSVAMLLGEGLVDASGRLLDPAEVGSPLGNRLVEVGVERHFIIYRDARTLVSISQSDIRQLQLAKGAVRAGIEVLLARGGVSAEDLEEVVITGSFGAALRLQSLNSIGVLTENMVKNARFVREGALAGAIRHLLAPDAGMGVESLAAGLKIIPLSGTPLFERHFLEQINFQQ